MTRSLFALVYITVFVHAAPQYNSQCQQVPSNPYAAQIGAQYLEIPGCNGNAGGQSYSNNNGPNSTPPASPTGSSPPPASPAGSSPLGTSNAQGTEDDDESECDSEPSGSANQPIPSSSSSTTTNSTTSSSTQSNTGGGGGGGGNIGQLYQSSITRYGQGPPGTGGTDSHCQSHQGSCGNNPKSGFTAAASEFLYFHGGAGVGSQGNAGGGSGGMSCGTCWKVWGGNDGSGKPIANTPIVVLITNECATQPAGEAPNLCSMTSLSETNSLGMNVNIDLCMDSGATQAFWGDPPWGTTTGRAQQVGCEQWCGVFADGRTSGPEGCQAPPANYAVTT